MPPRTPNSPTLPIASAGAVPCSERGICRVIATAVSGVSPSCATCR